MTTTVKTVSKKVLFVDPVNIRASEYESDEGLTNSIRAEGIIEPLIVRPVKGKLGIIAGGRRFRAGIEAGLKEFPVIVKKLDDNQAMGLSIQENLQRKNCPEILIAEKVSELYSNINSGASHSDKVKWFEEEIGVKERSLRRYRSMSALGKKFKKKFMYKKSSGPQVDTHTAEQISWGNYSDEEQLAIGKEIIGKDQKKATDFVKKIKSYKDKPIEEAIKKAKRIPEAISYSVSFDLKVQRAFQKFTSEKQVSSTEVIRKSVEQYLKRSGYL